MKLLKNSSSNQMHYFCKKQFDNKYVKDKTYFKVRDWFHYIEEYRGFVHNIQNLKYIAP